MLKTTTALDANTLRELCLEAGADDVGFVSLDHPDLAQERPYAERALSGVRTYISIVCRMNRTPLQSLERSVANLEFHATGEQVNETARHIVRALEARGIRALNPAMGFPMAMERWGTDRTWVIAHKPVAVAAGLGKMGIHRNVIHPRFGNFILLGTILVAGDIDAPPRVLDFNPCRQCKLCVAACPTGAISSDGSFDFGACYTHNYREFMSGFTDWVEQIADSRSGADYRNRVTDPESVSMWQSLSFGPNYKAAYCLAVCPAGDDVIAPFLQDRKAYLEEFVKPFQRHIETVYVVAGTDAEAYVVRKFPHKNVRRVKNGLRASSVAGFMSGLPRIFQARKAAKVDARYHFRFHGSEHADVTIEIKKGQLQVSAGLHGEPDLDVRADAETWLAFVRAERGLLPALLLGRIKLRGKYRLLMDFGKCFRS